MAGAVIHARAFPGWENIGSMIRHVRFVRDHHRKVRKVRKIGLAADSKVAAVVPQLANHFVRAEVRRFGYDELEVAVAWAAASPDQ
ncbi:STAS/SEC14 domain-containing protein [Streptomyces lydicus]|uniref:STAS/SEC14 domain-containing protein n=1 Tax=Streptomyces lydicus TaxID=47763 RepID=UPI0037D492FA